MYNEETKKKSDIQVYVENIVNELESATYDELIAYFDECLEIRFICSIKKEYEGCCVAVTLGGPNVLLYSSGRIEGKWGTERYATVVNENVRKQLWSWGWDLWNM